jgi:hypothetical protein
MSRRPKPSAFGRLPESIKWYRSSFRRRPESSFSSREQLDPGLRRDDGCATDPMSGHELPVTLYRVTPHG